MAIAYILVAFGKLGNDADMGIIVVACNEKTRMKMCEPEAKPGSDGIKMYTSCIGHVLLCRPAVLNFSEVRASALILTTPDARVMETRKLLFSRRHTIVDTSIPYRIE